MKLCIDADLCKKNKIPISTVLFIAALYLKSEITEETFDDACKRGFLEYDGFDLMRQPINLKITKKGEEYLESLILDSKNKSKIDTARFDALADKLRELFPEGKKAGCSLMWRDSTQTISKKLQAFVKRYGDNYTDEQIIAATKRYIQSFNGDYRYMQVLQYFIWKRITEDGESEYKSQLLSFLSNEEKDTKEDWTSTLN